jgi:hypothetical protein
MLFSIKLCDGVWTEVSSFAGFAMLAYPDFIELVHGLLNDFRVIGQDASLEVTSRFCFHADTSTSKIRASDIHLLAIKDKHFKPMEQ